MWTRNSSGYPADHTVLDRCGLAVKPVLAHVRVPVVGRRHEEFLNRTGSYPADQVEHRAGLVVGAAGPGTAERLLAYHRAGGLVVDVEVSGRVPQLAAGSRYRLPVSGDDRAGQRVARRVIHVVEDGLELAVRVDMHRQDRAEILGAEDLVRGVRTEQDRRPDKIAVRVAGRAAGQDGDR